MIMKYEKKKPWLKRIFTGKNWLILALTAVAFAGLNYYRMNDPMQVGSKIPDFTLETPSGHKFNISEIKTPVVLVFYKRHKAFSNFVFNATYRKMLPELKFLQDKNYAQVVVITDGIDTQEKVTKLAKDAKHVSLKEIGYATDTDKIAKLFGVRSWPHLFVINNQGFIIYEAKLAGADHIQQILWRN